MAAFFGILIFGFIVVAFLALILLPAGFRVVTQYERGVIFRLGRCVGAKGPGVFFVVPFFDKMVKTNLQLNAVPIQPQSVITKDNVTVSVDAVAFMQVIDPQASVVNVRDWYSAAQLVSQTTLRSIVGRHELDQLLSDRDLINRELQQTLDAQTETWGVQVHRVEVRDVILPDSMQRAMAKQAEAERERRAKIVAAQGELEASQKLSEAAQVMSREPAALQLRQLQTMVEISSERNSTIIFPIPYELLGSGGWMAKAKAMAMEDAVDLAPKIVEAANAVTTAVPAPPTPPAAE